MSGTFCSAPRGGVKGKWKIGRGPIERCVGRFRPVPRGGVKGKREKNKDLVRTVCATSLGFYSFLFVP